MISDTKLSHSIGVARECYRIAKEKYGYSEEIARAAWMTGYCHDVGYEFLKEGEPLDNHAKIGAELVWLAFRGESHAIKNHGTRSDEHSVLLDILNEADLMVDTKGNVVGIVKRLEDIKHRYGEASVEYKEALDIAKSLKLVSAD